MASTQTSPTARRSSRMASTTPTVRSTGPDWFATLTASKIQPNGSPAKPLKPGMWDNELPIGIDARIELDAEQVKHFKEYGGWWEPVAGRTRRGGVPAPPPTVPSPPTATSTSSTPGRAPRKSSPIATTDSNSATNGASGESSGTSKNSTSMATTTSSASPDLLSSSSTSRETISSAKATTNGATRTRRSVNSATNTFSPPTTSGRAKATSASANGTYAKSSNNSPTKGAMSATGKTTTAKSPSQPSTPASKANKTGNGHKSAPTTPEDDSTAKKRKRTAAKSTGSTGSTMPGIEPSAAPTDESRGLDMGKGKVERKQKKTKEGDTPQILMSLQTAVVPQDPPLIVPTIGSVEELLAWRDTDCIQARYYEYCRVWYSQPAPTDAWKPSGGDHYSNREQTYGEVTPEGMMCFFAELGIGKDDVFLDIGSGLGNLTLYASFVHGIKKSYGIEIQRNRHDVAEEIADDLALLQKSYWGRSNVEFVFTTESNLADCPNIKTILSEVSIIFCNNILFTPTTMAQVTDALLELVTNREAILVFTNDPWPRRSAIRPAPLRFWKSIEVNDACSWCSKNLKFYFYTFHEVQNEARKNPVPHYIYDAKSITAPLYVEDPNDLTAEEKLSLKIEGDLRAGRKTRSSPLTARDKSNSMDTIDALADLADVETLRAKKQIEREKRRRLAAQFLGRTETAPSEPVSMDVDTASTSSTPTTSSSATLPAPEVATVTPMTVDVVEPASKPRRSSRAPSPAPIELSSLSLTTPPVSGAPELKERATFLVPRTLPGELTHEQMIYIGFDAAQRGAQRKPSRSYVLTVASKP